MQTSTTANVGPRHKLEDRDYSLLLAHLRLALTGETLFTTDALGLYDRFLDRLPMARRGHYNCRTCRKFVDRFGGLVTISKDGRVESPLWSLYAFDGGLPPPFFSNSIVAVLSAVRNAKVTGVFLSEGSLLGDTTNSSPKSPTGVWHHMHACVTPCAKNALLTVDQVMAEKIEDYGMLMRGIADFDIDLVRNAHTLLTNGSLYRSGKCVGPAEWLLKLHESLAGRSKTQRENLVWAAVATAPPGFCHVRSTMIGTLLTDLDAHKPFADIKHSFDSKMDPRFYQRPQAAPKEGQLDAAEKVIEKLRSAGSLDRRYATLEDIADDAVWMWMPGPIPRAPKSRATRRVFGHLGGRGRASAASSRLMDMPTQTITWEKFWRTVLPTAESIECLVPTFGHFFGFLTAADKSAPPILQWDRSDARNPVSWYLHVGGSSAHTWGLRGGVYTPVTAITTQPSSWGGGGDHQGNGAYIVLEGARESGTAGLCLFPEILKAEYHGIRSAIEAYSNSRKPAAVSTPMCGLALQKSNAKWDGNLRVTSRGTRAIYILDRWD